MSNPDNAATSTPARIRSEYHPDQKPHLVGRWERWANEAGNDAGAQTQLLYHQLVQLRLIKLILAGALLVIPGIIVVVMVILANTIEFSTPGVGLYP
jgi:hypothetical protein